MFELNGRADVIEKAFLEDFLNQNASIMDDILSYIESIQGELKIVDRGINLSDALDRMHDPDKKYDLSIQKIENGISVPYCFSYLLELIKAHISESVSKIELPLSKIDLNILKDFKNIESITTKLSFPIEVLKFLADNTNIREINAPFTIFSFRDLLDCARNENLLVYKNLTIKNNSQKEESLNRNNNMEIRISNNSIDNVRSLIDKFDLIEGSKITIISEKGKIEIYLEKDKHANVRMNNGDLNKIKEIYDLLVDKGLIVDEIEASIKYIDSYFKHEEPGLFDKGSQINYSEFDYTELDELSKKVRLSIGYDLSYTDVSTYEEFRRLVEAVKYYRKLINDYELSPLEKLAFAYDIMKTFAYNESKISSKNSRNPHKIVKTGNIVCVGYTSFLEEIVNGLDDNIEAHEYGVTCLEKDDKTVRGHHSRSVVMINDEKYNVHGLYALDPTWDSIQSDGMDVYGEDYDALSLYRCFMIPFTEYGKTFKHEKDLFFFNDKVTDLNTNLTSENIEKELENMESRKHSKDKKVKNEKIFLSNFKSDFSKYSEEELLKSFDSRRITFQEFLSLISTVRMAEGYSGELLESEIQKIARINAKFYGQDIVDYEFERK